MKGLIIKDLLNLKKSLLTILAITVLYAIIGYTSNSMSMITAMIMIALSMMTITSIAYDDMAKWDTYALAMPIGRKKIVISKYVLSIILTLTGGILSTIITFVLMKIKGVETSTLLLESYSILLIALIYSSFMLPLIFKFGVENSRIMLLAGMGLPVGIGYILYQLGFRLPSEEVLLGILKLSPLILILILYTSFTISYEIYKKKEM